MNYAKFLRKSSYTRISFLTEHLWWLLLELKPFFTEPFRRLLLELTHNLMISISICFCKKFCDELYQISYNIFSYKTLLVASPFAFVRNFTMNYVKFLRTPLLTEHIRWLLLDLTQNLMISISIRFCNQTWFQNPCHI